MTIIHKKIPIPIKTADVDEKICDFVEWLNSFSSVETQFSCEGVSWEESKKEDIIGHSESDERSSYAYVSFYCGDISELLIIADCFQEYQYLENNGNRGYMATSFSYDSDSGKIVYSLSFEDNFVPEKLLNYYRDIYRLNKIFETDRLLPK